MIRRITQIEYAPGQYIDVPLYNREDETTQEILASSVQPAGGSFSVDLLGDSPGVLVNADERVAFLLVGDSGADVNRQYNDLKGKLYRGGRLTLWSTGDELDGDHIAEDVWTARARLRSMPSSPLGNSDRMARLVTLNFERSTLWEGEDLMEDPVAVGSFSIFNPGNAYIWDAVITTDGTYTGPTQILNTTSGYRLRSNGSGTKLRYDSGTGAVERWTGAAWVNDYVNFNPVPGQVQQMRIDPGTNNFTMSGFTGTITIDAKAKWY